MTVKSLGSASGGWGDISAHSNHVASIKRVDTLICHTTMCRNAITFCILQAGDPLMFGSSSGGVY